MKLVNVAYSVFVINFDADGEIRLPVAEIWANDLNDLTDMEKSWGGLINLVYGEDFREVRRNVFEEYGSRVNREAVCNEPPEELIKEEWEQLFLSVAHDNVDGKGPHEHTFEIYN